MLGVRRFLLAVSASIVAIACAEKPTPGLESGGVSPEVSVLPEDPATTRDAGEGLGVDGGGQDAGGASDSGEQDAGLVSDGGEFRCQDLDGGRDVVRFVIYEDRSQYSVAVERIAASEKRFLFGYQCTVTAQTESCVRRDCVPDGSPTNIPPIPSGGSVFVDAGVRSWIFYETPTNGYGAQARGSLSSPIPPGQSVSFTGLGGSELGPFTVIATMPNTPALVDSSAPNSNPNGSLNVSSSGFSLALTSPPSERVFLEIQRPEQYVSCEYPPGTTMLDVPGATLTGMSGSAGVYLHYQDIVTTCVGRFDVGARITSRGYLEDGGWTSVFIQ